MVLSRVAEERGEQKKPPATPMSNTTSGEGSSRVPLQNYDPPFPKWGSQRILRCIKVTEDQPREADAGNRKLNVLNSEESDGGIETVREKAMLDLKTKADEEKGSVLGKKNAVPEADHGSPAAVVEQQNAIPWNLRARKPKKDCGSGGSGGKAVEEKKRFSLKLTDAEIREDYITLFGRLPPRRPHKRPKNVQRDLDYIFPGLSLHEVTVEKYLTPEAKKQKK